MTDSQTSNIHYSVVSDKNTRRGDAAETIDARECSTMWKNGTE